MDITGTSHFVSTHSAIEYYRPYEPNMNDWELLALIVSKLSAGEISIGKPELKPGQTLSVIKGEGRYAIHTPDEPAPRFKVVKIFRVSQRRQVLLKNLSESDAQSVVASYPNSSRSMVVYYRQ